LKENETNIHTTTKARRMILASHSATRAKAMIDIKESFNNIITALYPMHPLTGNHISQPTND
jgi:hypothetical protein